MNCSLRRLAISMLFLACALELSPAHAAEPVSSTGSIAGFDSLVLLTGGASAGDMLPMIIGLHYSSASPQEIAADFEAIDFPARIILPQGKHRRRDGYSWFADGYEKLDAAEQMKAALAAMDEISSFIREAAERYPTSGKPVITGISYGGDLSYLIAVHHPDQVAGAFPVAARFPAAWLPESRDCGSRCPKIVVMHGTVDAIVPIEGARDAARRLRERGYPVELREYAGVGHDFPAQMKSDFTRQVKEMFAAKIRTPER